MMKTIRVWFIVPLICFLFACSTVGPSGSAVPTPKAVPVKKGEITIGSKSMTEQYLLMKMTSLELQAHGFQVKEMVFLDSPAIRSAMENDIIDLYWEYTSTALINYQKKPPIFDADQAFQAVAKEDQKKGIIWLPRSQLNSSWAVLMREELANKLHIGTISELADYVRRRNPGMRIATNEEYLYRADGFKRLEQVYEFSIPKEQVMAVDTSLLSQAVQESRVEVAVGMAADARIKAAHLVVLRDDRHVFPPYDAAPVILNKTLMKNPSLRNDLKQISSLLTNQNMLELLYKVDIQHQDITQTARAFLTEHHLLQP
jgi:osmoprotectant transport system substrate-binding protein